jgi:phosphotransferase family enzyme
MQSLPAAAQAMLASLFQGSDGISVETLPCNRWLTSGIWKVSCGTQSLILKELSAPHHSPADSWDAHWIGHADAPDHWNYWKREALVYDSDLTKTYIQSGIGPPRLVRLEVAGDRVYLWTENISAPPAAQWELLRYGKAAYALGKAQGRIVGTQSLSGVDWLSKNYLLDYSEEKPFDLASLEDSTAWRQHLIVDYFPPGLRAGLRRFSDLRHELLRIAAILPQTLCHNDFWTRNLFGTDTAYTFLIDWAFAGLGCVGQDIGNLVPSAALDGFISPDYLPTLERIVLSAYITGLQESDWPGDERLVRLGMYASAVKYVWLGAAMLSSASDPDHPTYIGYGEGPVDALFLRVGKTLEFLISWADNAFRLGSELMV